MVNRLQSAVYKLIEKYVQRQSIVLDAMRDLRPDKVLPLESKLDPQTRAELRRKYIHAPTRGFWGKNQEWEYRLHGIGCHLTHTVTGEVIGWDVGSIKRFDWTWFVDHLAWLLKKAPDNTEARIIAVELHTSEIEASKLREKLREFIFPIIQQLEKEGVLRAERENRYTLTKEVG